MEEWREECGGVAVGGGRGRPGGGGGGGGGGGARGEKTVHNQRQNDVNDVGCFMAGIELP